MSVPSSFVVTLGALAVGQLQIDRHGACSFRLLPSYRDAYPRPVLGQAFLDELDTVCRSRIRLPPWFSNLLPEGALRELLVRQSGLTSVHEYTLLHRLRDDLPGNVFLRDEDGASPLVLEDAEQPAVTSSSQAPWKFSLAGLQLKMSVRQSGRGFTIPVSGVDGDWILKLPDPQFPGVPANEFSTMAWARASGLQVPETAQVPLAAVAGLEALPWRSDESLAYAVRRFDRPSPGVRTHMEDFAQVAGLYPERKYERLNYEAMARVVAATVPPADWREYLLRLVFMVASGNGDAHLKNWSLLYPDGVQARLSPAYDLLSTIQYLPGDSMALNLGGSKAWTEVTRGAFVRMARKAGMDESATEQIVAQAVQSVLEAWRTGATEFGYNKAQRDRLELHMRAIPLLR